MPFVEPARLPTFATELPDLTVWKDRYRVVGRGDARGKPIVVTYELARIYDDDVTVFYLKEIPVPYRRASAALWSVDYWTRRLLMDALRQAGWCYDATAGMWTAPPAVWVQSLATVQ